MVTLTYPTSRTGSSRPRHPARSSTSSTSASPKAVGQSSTSCTPRTVVVDIPLAKPEPEHVEGHETIRKHFAAAEGFFALQVVGDRVVHETTDPEVVIAEFDYEGQVIATGRTFRVSNVQVVRVRDGLIVESRDYHDHFAMAAATGQLPELVAALSPQE
jgi:ketosteroid isomerase-like protein